MTHELKILPKWYRKLVLINALNIARNIVGIMAWDVAIAVHMIKNLVKDARQKARKYDRDNRKTF